MSPAIVAAMGSNREIGLGKGLPWHLPADLKHFKNLTLGHHLIMGRATYESIGRLLPDRTMIVVTRQRDYRAPGCLVAHTIEDAIALAESRDETEAFVIGGAQVYAQSLLIADRLYLTQVHTRVACDVHFPDFDRAEWQEVERREHPADENNGHPFTFSTLERAR